MRHFVTINRSIYLFKNQIFPQVTKKPNTWLIRFLCSMNCYDALSTDTNTHQATNLKLCELSKFNDCSYLG